MNFYTINRGVYKRLYRYFSYQATKYSSRKEIKDKIKKLKCKPLTKAQKKEIKNYYKSFGFKNISSDWHRLFTHINGDFHKEYIPQDFFYNVVEPSLNMYSMFPALMDKNLLDKIFTNVKQPKTIVKNINGIYLDGITGNFLNFNKVVNKCKQFSNLVIKPSLESGGGKNVNIINLNKEGITDLNGLTIEQLLVKHDKNFIIQELFTQHKQMSLLNPDSVNTIRFKTLYFKGEIVHLYSVVRVGGKGVKVDNTSQGGFFCKIDSEGKLFNKGYFGNGDFTLKTDSGLLLEGFQIPNYTNIRSVVLKLHEQIPYFKMVSWDISIDELKYPNLIEFNIVGQGFSEEFGPLFGKYTNEVLKNSELKLFSI